MDQYINKFTKNLIIYTFALFVVLFAVCGGILYAINQMQTNKYTLDFEPIKLYETKMIEIKLPSVPEADEEQMKATLEQKAFDLTNSYIGIGGDCFQLSMRFIKELKGIENPEYIEITEKDSITADLIFYERSSTGTTHYAVKLNENIAYQPNIDGKAKIGKIHYDNFSKPIFYRVVEKKGME